MIMRRFLFRLVNVFRRERGDEEVTREIKGHLALLEDEYCRRGMSPDEARLAARRALGSVALAKDLHRDARMFVWLDDLQRDVTHGWRSLRRTPGFTVVAVVTLALGIGANAAIFSVISGVLLRPLPYRDADRLVQVFGPARTRPGAPAVPRRGRAVAPAHLELLRAGTPTLSDVGGYILTSATLTGVGDPARLTGIQMTASMIPMLGVPPMFGRSFEAREEAAGADAVVVLSHSAWQRHFNSDPGIVGRVVALDGRGRSVIGVMPATFAFPDTQVQYWIPYVPPAPDARSFFSLTTIARLRDGVAQATAEDDLNRVVRAAPGTIDGRFEIGGVRDELVGSVRPALLILAGAVGLVLLIACVNVANLLLARTAARDREIAVRRAVGASPGRLLRQLLTESTLLAGIGGFAGVGVAAGAIALLRRLAVTLPRRDLGNPGVSLPRIDDIAVDVPVLMFTIGVALLTGLLCGVLPAFRHSRAREADRVRAYAANGGVRATLVVAEIAMAMVLLVGGGLLIHSFMRLATAERGYDSTQLLTFQAQGRVPAGPEAKAFADQLVDRVRSLPGVIAAGYANNLPLVQQGFGRDMSSQPNPVEPPRSPFPGLHAVSPGMLTAMGMRVVEGRGFSAGEPGRKEALITRTFARSGFFEGPPLGSRIYSGKSSQWEVVGILEDMSQFSLHQPPGSEVFVIDFVPAPPGLGGTYFAVRTSGDPLSVAASVRSLVRQLDPAATVDNIATMDQIVSNAMSRPRFYAVLLGTFAGVAMVLAGIGIYGVLAYLVAQRTREIGIRMALGARHAQVVALVMRQTAILTVVGIAIGVAGASALSRSLEGLLFGVTPLDVTTFVAVVVVFGAVAALASYIPARRATRVDPLVALRSE
jgi:putative ABC transport system permease protein